MDDLEDGSGVLRGRGTQEVQKERKAEGMKGKGKKDTDGGRERR